jgi:hypothetical protein
MRTTTTDPPGLVESRVRCKSHARFGKRLRGNGPVERPEPRPGPTSPMEAGMLRGIKERTEGRQAA